MNRVNSHNVNTVIGSNNITCTFKADIRDTIEGYQGAKSPKLSF